jgi:hypothetical protein
MLHREASVANNAAISALGDVMLHRRPNEQHAVAAGSSCSTGTGPGLMPTSVGSVVFEQPVTAAIQQWCR